MAAESNAGTTGCVGEQEVSAFEIGKHWHDVWIEDGSIHWKSKGTEATITAGSIELKKIIAVEVKDVGKAKEPTSCLLIHHITPKVKAKESAVLEVSQLKLNNQDKGVCEQWEKRIRSFLSTTETQRPKRLLVFVNPNSGSGKGRQVFKKEVAPLFALAGVTTDVIETRDRDHSTEVIQTYDLASIDGIITVSGDGTFMWMYNALLARCARDAGIDPGDPEAELVVPCVPVGLIAAGTACMWVRIASGSASGDVTTSVLNIITGTEMRSDILTVHNDRKLLASSTLGVAFGFIVDMFKDGDKYRGIGPLRVVVAVSRVMGLIMRNDSRVDMDLQYLLFDEQPVADDTNPPDQVKQKEWQHLSGSYSAVDMLKYSHAELPDGADIDLAMRLYSQFENNGFFWMHLTTTEATRKDRLGYLKAMATFKNSCYSYPACSSYKVTAVKVELKPTDPQAASVQSADMLTSVDAENITITNPQVDIKLRPKLLRVFGPGSDLMREYLKKI